jgi:hypothetical protein
VDRHVAHRRLTEAERQMIVEDLTLLDPLAER